MMRSFSIFALLFLQGLFSPVSFAAFSIQDCIRVIESVDEGSGAASGSSSPSLNLPHARVSEIISLLTSEHLNYSRNANYKGGRLESFLQEYFRRDPSLLRDFDAFEDHILLQIWPRVENLAPQFRPLDGWTSELMHEFGISRTEAQRLVLLYGFIPSVTPSTGIGLRVHAGLAHEAFRNEHREEIEFYENNITLLSVPEMAQRLSQLRGRPVNEDNVRYELLNFDISREAIWRRPISLQRQQEIQERLGSQPSHDNLLDLAISLHAQGRSIPDIARILGVGELSLRHILHYIGVVPHGTEWTESERTLLISEHHNIPVWEIADILGRTMPSISGEAQRLGITIPANRPTGPIQTVRNQYPGIWQNEHLRRDVLERYLWDAVENGKLNDQMATELGVGVSTVGLWRRRLGIRTAAHVRTQSRATPAHLTQRYQWQEHVINKAMEFFIQNGRFPTVRELDTVSGFNVNRIISATSLFRPGGARAHLGIFANHSDLVIAFDSQVRSRMAELRSKTSLTPNEQSELRNLETWSVFRIEHVIGRSSGPTHSLQALFDHYRPIERQKLYDIAFERIENGEVAPMSTTALAKFIGISNHQLNGLIDYGPGSDSFHRRINDSRENTVQTYNRAIEERIRSLQTSSLSDRAIRIQRLEAARIAGVRRHRTHPHLTTPNQWREHTLETAIAFFLENGSIPDQAELSRMSGFDKQRLFSTSRIYQPGGESAHLAIFQSHQDFVIAFDTAIRNRVLELRTRSNLLAHEQLELQRLESWNVFQVGHVSSRTTTGVDPRFQALFDFYRPQERQRFYRTAIAKIESGESPPTSTLALASILEISQSRLVGTGSYSPQGGQSYRMRLNDSREEAVRTYNAAIDARIAELQNSSLPDRNLRIQRLQAAHIQ